MDGFECAGYQFYSNFDSGNLHRVEHVKTNSDNVTPQLSLSGKSEIPDVEFNLWTKPDCGGTEFENGNRTWFYFGIKAPVPSTLVKFNIINLNKQAKLFSQGMGPVYKILPSKPHWERIWDKTTYSNDNNVFTLSFKMRTPENLNTILYLAFTYPYTYGDIQAKLDTIDRRMKAMDISNRDDIYYVRECVVESLEGRRVDLLTISSFHNITAEREPRLKGLFSDGSTPRPYKFLQKKVIFISSRVHPGETPASYVFNGLLNLLLSRDDQVAMELRRSYVFKLIPCLNPDGVAKGHYRTDTRGVNLNRVYLNPHPREHPSIYAARALIRYHHYGYEKEEEETEGDVGLLSDVSHMTLQDNINKNLLWCKKCKTNFILPEEIVAGPVKCGNCGELIELNDNGDGAAAQESGLFLYLDMHGHASKKGIFMYGNHFDDVESNVDCMLLPKIMSINNHNFHFTACNFTERNMYTKDKRDGMSKEGSGRVAVFKLTGLVQSYTLECNYNTGRLVNILPPTIKETVRPHHILVPPKYNPHVFEEVGKAIGFSILDLTSQNPLTRLPHSEYHSLTGLKDWLRIHCNNDLAETRKSPNKQKIRHSASLHAQGKAVRSLIVKSRSLSKYNPKKVNLKQLRSPKAKKEKAIKNELLNPQPSCSYVQSPTSSSSRVKCVKTKSLTMQQKGIKATTEKPRVSTPTTVNHITKNIQNIKSKYRPSDSPIKTGKDATAKEQIVGLDEKSKLKEICYVKDGDRKQVIAKYEHEGEDENLIVAWNATSSKPQVFTHKSRIPAFLAARSKAATGDASDAKRVRVHHFQKTKRNKRIFKRIGSASTDNASKIKKKLLKKQSQKTPK